MRVRLQKQAFKHDPPETYGDCHRTALAMILGLERDDVPHFFEHGVPAGDAFSDERRWLADRGCVPIMLALQHEDGHRGVIDAFCEWNQWTPFLLGGTSQQGNGHTVAVYDGEVFDPSLDAIDEMPAITGPCSDGFYWITFVGAML